MSSVRRDLEAYSGHHGSWCLTWLRKRGVMFHTRITFRGKCQPPELNWFTKDNPTDQVNQCSNLRVRL